jgi:ATP-dependent helicase/nuclease subunit A
MEWSKEQRAAIYARRQNLLVAAAAGSGKTAVLVERIIRRITDDADPLDVDKLLVVTFTNAAAAEMRSRIAAAISSELKSGKRSRHLERQLVLLNSASISTLHAFCQSVVRQNFHLLDIDPKFRIAGEAECALLKNEVLENLFEERYDAADEDFLNFVEHYGDEHGDDSLYNLVLGLYGYSRSHPWPEYWLGGLTDAFMLPEATDIDATPWSKLIREKIAIELEQGRHQLDLLAAEAVKPGGPEAYAATFAADQTVIDDLTAAARHSWERLAAVIAAVTWEKLPAVKGVAAPVRTGLQDGRNKIKHKIAEYQTLFFDRPAGELLDDMRKVAPLVHTLAELTTAFAARYSAAKKEKGVADFSDLEHFCLKVLLDEKAGPDEIRPSAVALALQEKYAEIMVDEYQDTNGVQETIIQLLARRREPNLFMVGDVKQSIYRFRLAEPELFMDKYRRYPTADGHSERRIDLAQNFRSRPGILHAANFLFTQLMSPRVAELDYGPAEQLNPGPDYPRTDGATLAGAVELLLIDKDDAEAGAAGAAEDPEDRGEERDGAGEDGEEAELTGFELEAQLIARRINEFKSGNYQVYDKGNAAYRNLTWRDIVILLRSPQNKAAVLLERLRKAGIPAYAESDSGYFREIEVQVMLSLLTIIDNPRQDIHLAGVLRSPLVGITAAELAEIRMSRSDGDLWSAVKAFDSETGETGKREQLGDTLRAFLDRYARWRALSRRKGVPELIWHIYRDTGYYDYAGGMPGGQLRQANLRALYDRARQYEATNFRGLFRFLRFITAMRDKGSDLAVARALGESEDVVRIMSIHKSKGLEFPVVFVADLGKNFNLQDSRGLVLTHKTLGVGPYVINPELRYRYPTLARYGIAYKINMETKAEELRILYVALTRAREKLILVGAVNKLAKKAEEWSGMVGRAAVKLPDALLAGARSYLDWIGPAVARHPSAQELRDYAGCSGAAAGAFADDPSEWKIEVYTKVQLSMDETETHDEPELLEAVRRFQPVEEGEGTGWVDEVLGWRYPYGSAMGKSAKMAVTEIKRRFELLDEDAPRPFERPAMIVRPRFLQAGGRMTATEYGTMMHTVMQHISLAGALDEAGIVAQIGEMVANEILLPEQGAAVDAAAIAAFFDSTLGRRMRAAEHVEREMPFSIMLPAYQLYPELRGADESIFVQGVVDVLFTEKNGFVLVDYKTDKGTNKPEIASRYAVQLNLYAQAVEAILHRPVREKYLYLLSMQETIRM